MAKLFPYVATIHSHKDTLSHPSLTLPDLRSNAGANPSCMVHFWSTAKTNSQTTTTSRGARNARGMISDIIITQHTASEGGEEQDPFPVAIAYWPTDTHCARWVIRNGIAHNEGSVFKEEHHKWKPFGTSYCALVPKEEAVNVLSATCPSTSHFYELGQACANACDIALALGAARPRLLEVQAVPYDVLRERLLTQGAVLAAELVGKPDFSLLG
ncbi:uncharacterized protein BDV17DRAFT_296420 [Aspergillus undulatus]|uniref:uncharacterized protein n=1 Tax=Aspergillus undulatus TaxID=1810928 RepID=UPI003CCD7300